MINFKNYLVSATAAALIAASSLSFASYQANAVETNTTVNANTEVVKTSKIYMPYKAFTTTELTEESKGMSANMDFTGQIEIVDGKKYAYITLKNSQYWAGMETEVNGVLTEVETVSEDTAANTKLVKFEVNDLNQSIATKIKINAGPNRVMEHTIYLKFDAKATAEQAFQVWDKEKEKISSSLTRSVDSKIQIVKEGEKQYAYLTLLSAKYWKGLKTEVNGELVEATVISEDAAADTKVVKFEVPSRNALIEMASSIAAGAYSSVYTTYLDLNNVLENSKYKAIEEKDFKVWNKEKTAISSMKKYMPTPAKIVEKDGKQYAEVSITGANYWKGFKVSVGGELVEATVAEENLFDNTRVYRFELPTQTELIQADTHISVGGLYDTTHTTYLDFNNIVKEEVVVPEPEIPAVDPVASTTNYNYAVLSKSKKYKGYANNYMTHPMKVEKTKSGKYYATVTLKNASMWSLMKTEVNGKMTKVTTVSSNKAKNTKVVKFQIDSPKATPKTTFTLKTNVKVKGKSIAGNYTNYIKVGSVYVKPVTTVAKAKYNSTIVKADGKTTSAANKYMTSPTTVQKMSDGKYYATTTLKNASMWSLMKTEVNGKMVKVTTVSSNKAKDTKVIKYQVKNTKATTKTTFKLNTSNKTLAGNYTNYVKLGAKYVAPTSTTSKKNYNFTVLKDDKKTVSVTNDYVTSPVQVEKLSNGKYYATLTIKNADWWKSFKTEVNGKMTEVKTLSTNKKTNTKVVKFEIASPTKQVKANIHIKNNAIGYEGKYTTYLKFGSEAKIVQVANSKSYKKSFTVYKYNSKKKSVMDKYVKKPAKIQKIGKTTYATVTLKNPTWWKSFKVKHGGKYVNAKVISKTKTTRTVRFPVSSFKGVYVKTHIVVPGMKYNNKYTTKIVFK